MFGIFLYVLVYIDSVCVYRCIYFMCVWIWILCTRGVVGGVGREAGLRGGDPPRVISRSFNRGGLLCGDITPKTKKPKNADIYIYTTLSVPPK